MTTQETFTGIACSDCIMAIANGDTSGIEDYDRWVDGVESTDATEDGKYTVIVTDDGESSWFTSMSCDYCSSGLAGDRYEITFIENR